MQTKWKTFQAVIGVFLLAAWLGIGLQLCKHRAAEEASNDPFGMSMVSTDPFVVAGRNTEAITAVAAVVLGGGLLGAVFFKR
jgi:hypothetical protein